MDIISHALLRLRQAKTCLGMAVHEGYAAGREDEYNQLVEALKQVESLESIVAPIAKKYPKDLHQIE